MATVDANLYKVPAGTLYQTSPNTQTGYVTNTAADNSIFTQQQAQATTQQAPAVSAEGNTSTDGKDDGKVGFFEGIGSFFKGIGKTVVNTVVGIVTDPKKLLLTAGAIALSIVCPPAGVAMAVAGGVMAGKQIVESGIAAATATTDAEAKDALENMGGGALQLGLSVAGAKAGLKAMKGVDGSAMGTLTKSTSKGLKGVAQNTKAGVKAYLTDAKSSLVGGKGYETTNLLTRGKNAVSGLRNAKTNGLKNTATKAKETINPNKTKFNAEKQALEAEVTKAQKALDAADDATKASAQKKLDIAKAKSEGHQTKVTKATEASKGELAKAKADLAKAKEIAKKLPDNKAAQAKVADLQKIVGETRTDLNTNLATRTTIAANNAAKTAGYTSLTAASIPAVNSTLVEKPNQSGQLLTTPYTDAGAATTTSQPKTFGYDITTETPNYFDPNLQTGFNEAAYNNFMLSNGAYPQYQV